MVLNLSGMVAEKSAQMVAPIPETPLFMLTLFLCAVAGSRLRAIPSTIYSISTDSHLTMCSPRFFGLGRAVGWVAQVAVWESDTHSPSDINKICPSRVIVYLLGVLSMHPFAKFLQPRPISGTGDSYQTGSLLPQP
jgi:hypothetical protein